MDSVFTTPQEAFWAGEFGDEYIERNSSSAFLHASRLSFWAKVLQKTPELTGQTQKSCLELGANIGLNLKAIAALSPELALSAVEINKKAAEKLLGGE